MSLKKNESHTELIAAMNTLIREGNLKRMQATGGRCPLVPPFNERQVQQAVFMARQRTGYSELLQAAGY